MVDAMLVDMSGHRDQIGEHGVAHSCGDFSVGQGIEADINDSSLSDDLHPVKDRSWVI